MHGRGGGPVGRRGQGEDRRCPERRSRHRRPLSGRSQRRAQRGAGRPDGGAPPGALGRHASRQALPDRQRGGDRSRAARGGGRAPRVAGARGPEPARGEPGGPPDPPVPPGRRGGGRAGTGGDRHHGPGDRVRLPRQGRAHRPARLGPVPAR